MKWEQVAFKSLSFIFEIAQLNESSIATERAKFFTHIKQLYETRLYT